MAKEQSQLRERQRTDLREPRRYKVIIYNDDFTTMEFVVMILKQVFLKSEEEAEALMLQVHHSDKAVVASIAMTLRCRKLARLPRWRESMFSLVPNASKLALIHQAKAMERIGARFIDCQFETPLFKSMGGRHITYEEYMKILGNSFDAEVSDRPPGK